jgi:hypothetical protein
MVIGTDCMGSCQTNYHTITAMTTPIRNVKIRHVIYVYKMYKLNLLHECITNYILDRHWSPFQPSLQIHVPFTASQKFVFSWAHRQLEVHSDPYVKTSQSKNVTTKRINIDKLSILTCAFSTEWPYFVLVLCFSCLDQAGF